MSYRISKNYEASPSRNVYAYEEDLSKEDAIESLDSIERAWRKSGIVISREEEKLIVSEENGESEITFEIHKQTKEVYKPSGPRKRRK